jgi:enoyl-CoA hydratase/carnithine racemase
VSKQAILYDVDDKIARITLNKPEKRNALNYEMVQRLIELLRQAENDSAVRVVLLRAAGDHFCAGGNLREFLEEIKAPAVQHWEEGALWEELFALVPHMTKPVVAAVQGYALAGGCGLVALSDLAIAADDAKFGTTEIRIGLFPLLILPALRRAVGEKKALEMALTARIVAAEDGLKIGLVNHVVPRAELEDAALTLARDLAAKSPDALRLGKHCFYAMADMSYDEALAFARSLRVTVMLGEDLREGVTAFLDKRQPDWG